MPKKLSRNRAVIAFGANLGQREDTIRSALQRIEEEVGLILKKSSILETEPMVLPGTDPISIPSYLNGVVLIETTLSPDAILTRLLQIEVMLGRDRSVETSRWMSRIIDLDLICVEQKTVESEDLKLPHPEMHRRDFVLKPMSEVCPDWIHPVLKRSVAELLSELHKG